MSKIVNIVMILLFLVACTLTPLNKSTPSAVYDINFTSSPQQPTILSVTTTPILTSTVIPTVATLPPSLNSFVLVFTSNGGLWIWKDGITTRLANASIGTPAFTYNTNPISLSDDGQFIAFTKGDYEVGDYEVWTIKADETDETKLAGADFFNKIPLQQIIETGGVVALPFQIQWLPRTHTLLVNTLGWIGTGFYAPFVDLYAFDLDNGKTTTLVSANTGSYFYPSPDGKQIAIVQPDLIDIMNVTGNKRKNIVTFSGLSIYYEPYYGEVIWGTDSNTFAMIVPPTINNNHLTGSNKIIQVSNNKPIQKPTEFPWNDYQNLFAKISPDFSHFTYPVSRDGNPNKIDLHVAVMDLSKDIISTKIELPENTLYKPIRWAPDSEHYLLIRTNNILVGDTEGLIEPLLSDSFHVEDAAWIDSETILLFGEGEIRIGTIGNKESIFLTNAENFNSSDFFDFVK